MMRAKAQAIIFGFLLAIVIGFIVYDLVNETVVKPVQNFQEGVNRTLDEAFRGLEP